MTEIEQQLRAAMHKAVDAREAMPGSLIAAVRKRHRRRTRLLACLAVLLIAAVAIPAAVLGAALVTSSGPAAHRPAPAKRLPTTLTGLPLPPGTTMQLLVPDPAGWAAWYSTATGTVTPIAGFGVPGAGGDVRFGRVQGGFIVTGGRIHPFCARYFCAGPAFDYYFVADGSRVATKIGAGFVNWGVVASGRAGAVWLTSYPRSSDNVATTSALAQLVSISGQALGPRYLLPAGYLPEAGVGGYLLLRAWPKSLGGKAPSGPPVGLLWDPATHRVVRRIVDPFAAGTDQIAWTQGCRGCPLQILNVATGKNLSTSIPAGLQTVWGYNATFSDSGQLLRLTTPGPQGGSFFPGAASTPGGAVDIISTATGRALAVIPVLSNRRWVTVQWLAGGPTLLVADGPTRGSTPPTQAGFWQPGDSRLHIATFTPAQEGGQLLQSAANLAAG